jgi:hypothetical protein
MRRSTFLFMFLIVHHWGISMVSWVSALSTLHDISDLRQPSQTPRRGFLSVSVTRVSPISCDTDAVEEVFSFEESMETCPSYSESQLRASGYSMVVSGINMFCFWPFLLFPGQAFAAEVATAVPESATAANTVSPPPLTFWEQFALAAAPGLPMLVTIAGVIFFVLGSFKVELKSELKADIRELQNGMKDLGSKIDTLTVSIQTRFDNQDSKIDHQNKKIALQDNKMAKVDLKIESLENQIKAWNTTNHSSIDSNGNGQE